MGVAPILFQYGSEVAYLIQEGTSAVYRWANSIRGSFFFKGYKLYVLENGGVEQDPYDWWNAMYNTTKKVFKENNITADQIRGDGIQMECQNSVMGTGLLITLFKVALPKVGHFI